MPDIAVFLDDGGVMNDNRLRYAEWQRLLGEFFSPRLGGSPERWAEANRTLIARLWDQAMMDQARMGLVDAYHEWSRLYQIDWLRTMAAHVGASTPDDEDEAFALAVEAASYVTLRCRSAFSDARAAIRKLALSGLALHTASGEDSRELDGYLSCMGVRENFQHLFGPDLVNAFKAGPVYYERAFDLAGLDPLRCLVVDDSPEALGWAAEAGARTILMDREGTKRAGWDGSVISSLAELLPLLERIEA
jgi:HAD superfamily hydrolase (TIGR01509 family)